MKLCPVTILTAVVLVLIFVFYFDSGTETLNFNERKNIVNEYGCECQSLFTLNACDDNQPSGEIGIGDYFWKKEIKKLERFRKGLNDSTFPAFSKLSRYVQQKYKIHISYRKNIVRLLENHLQSFDGNRSRYTSFETISEPVPILNGFPSCDVHQYSPSDVIQCTKIFTEKYNKPLRIHFVGDSLVRSIMEGMVGQIYKELDLKFENSSFDLDVEKHFINHALHITVPIIGKGIEFRLFWAPFLEKNQPTTRYQNAGARDLLSNWANGIESEKAPLPDILYIGGGIWDASSESGVDATESTIYRMERLTKILDKLSQRIRILWHFHPETKVWNKKSNISNGTLELNNQLYWLYLRQTSVWIWDSLALLSMKEFTDCLNFLKSRLLHLIPKEWQCSDSRHPGSMLKLSGANMIWNLACNRVLKKKINFCCS